MGKSRLRVSWEIKDFIAKGTPLTEELYAFKLETGLDVNKGREAKLRPIKFTVVRNIDQHSNQFLICFTQKQVIKEITIQLETISDDGALLSRTTFSAADTKVTFRSIPSNPAEERAIEGLTCESQDFSRL